MEERDFLLSQSLNTKGSTELSIQEEILRVEESAEDTYDSGLFSLHGQPSLTDPDVSLSYWIGYLLNHDVLSGPNHLLLKTLLNEAEYDDVSLPSALPPKKQSHLETESQRDAIESVESCGKSLLEISQRLDLLLSQSRDMTRDLREIRRDFEFMDKDLGRKSSEIRQQLNEFKTNIEISPKEKTTHVKDNNSDRKMSTDFKKAFVDSCKNLRLECQNFSSCFFLRQHGLDDETTFWTLSDFQHRGDLTIQEQSTGVSTEKRLSQDMSSEEMPSHTKVPSWRGQIPRRSTSDFKLCARKFEDKVTKSTKRTKHWAWVKSSKKLRDESEIWCGDTDLIMDDFSFYSEIRQPGRKKRDIEMNFIV